MKRQRNRLIASAVAAALGSFAGGATAGGFQLIEQNASGLGNAYAGQAAAAQDASTIFFNPAGMTRLPGRQGVAALNLIRPSAEFNNTGTTPAISTITGTGPFPLNGTGGDAGDLAFVPNAYLSWQLTQQLFVGVGVNVPFGLKTDYDANWMGRFHALKSEFKSININPSVAFKVNDTISIAAGLNWQRVEAELTKAVNYSFLASAGGLPGVPALTEGSNKIEGDDHAWGYNLGVLLKVGPNTDVGVSYRSKMSYTLNGSVNFFNRPAAVQGALVAPAVFNQAGDGPISADVTLPDTISVGVKHQINPSWEVLADVTRTGWSSLDTLRIVRSNGSVLEDTPFDWRDTWRFGVGVNYRMSQPWTLRFGVAYDQTPTKDAFRTPRIPDQNRTWVALGAQYKLSQAGAIDVGYAHLFLRDASINLSGPPALSAALVAGRGALRGDFDGHVDIFSIQYRHNF
jgi:long-chain fatty acid transport protein